MKQKLSQLRPRAPLALYLLRAGLVLTLACYLLALIVTQSSDAAADPELLVRAVPMLLETAPGFTAAGFSAAVLIEISARDLEK